ncbi:uncharacterized protein METZ01_LOCUS159393, partial [marine metagenome]
RTQRRSPKCRGGSPTTLPNAPRKGRSTGRRLKL